MLFSVHDIVQRHAMLQWDTHCD